MKEPEPTSRNGLLDFSLALLQQEDTENNNVISPISVYYCLTLAANAAGGETKAQMEQVLGDSTEELNALCKALSSSLTDVGGSTTLEIANGVFTDEAFAISEDYRKTVTAFLEAEIDSVPLATGEGMNAINAWASDKTHGIINDLLTQPPAGPAVLLNAIYLKATWANQFSPSNTKDAPFNLLSGQQTVVPFMAKKNSEETYLHADGVEGVLLPYDDGKLSFVALLPEDYSSFVSSLDADLWNTLLASKQQATMNLKLPRFTISQDTELNPMLIALGIRDLFSADCADLHGLLADETLGIYVDRAFQKAKIEVGEEGTVAAAVTGMTTRAMARPSQTERNLTFDRPFVYAVIDNESGIPLFLGTVTNPE